VRSEIDILKQQEAVQKKIFEHYKAGTYPHSLFGLM
jgi:hypothetical protein